MSLVRKYARRARSYRSAYKRIRDATEAKAEPGSDEFAAATAASFELVEKFVRHAKIHRCILNQEGKYLRESGVLLGEKK